MKTFIADIIPKIQRFSRRLDDVTLLTDQHWVSIDEIKSSKTVYIFRRDNSLLISRDGRVERAKWEYLGHESLIIDTPQGSYLFRHGFADQNILALRLDGADEYAVFLNETKYSKELNNIQAVAEFLSSIYIAPGARNTIGLTPPLEVLESTKPGDMIYSIKQGTLVVRREYVDGKNVFRTFLNGIRAPDGKYTLDFLSYIKVKNGIGQFSSSPFG